MNEGGGEAHVCRYVCIWFVGRGVFFLGDDEDEDDNDDADRGGVG